MTSEALGFAARHHRRFETDAAARGAALDLMVSPAWGLELRYFRSTAAPGQKKVRRPGVLVSSQRRAIVDEMLQHPANRMIGIATNSYDDETSGGLDMVRADEWTPIAQTYGHCAAQIADPASAWVDAVVDFLDKVSAVSAVIVKMDAMHVSTEVTGCGMTYEGVFQHPAPDEFQRMGHPDNVAHIGTRYVRFPRWGTLLSHDHVAQLGGAATIIAAVRPAVVRELSGGVYFQLTASIDDARSDEAAAKQRGFVELAAPLLPS